MRIDSSALLVLLAASASASASAARRPWGVLTTQRTPPPLLPAAGARWSVVPRGGDDSSAAATATEVPPPPPPPPPEAPPAAASEETVSSAATADDEDFDDLDARVQRAMKKLGLSSGDDDDAGGDDADAESSAPASSAPEGAECKDGVCELPPAAPSAAAEEEAPAPAEDVTDPLALADSLSSKYSIPRQVVLASIGASGYTGKEGEKIDVEAVENILEGERMLMSTVEEDAEEVKQLTSEGHDSYLTRRALAFADMNVDDARAILLADMEDEEEERKAREKAEEEYKKAKAEADRKERERAEGEMKTVEVAAGFDPAAPGAGATSDAAAGLKGLMGAGGGADKAAAAGGAPQGAPTPAKKEDVVFEITDEDQIQSLIIESPVPVLLDVYADWCGPCKMLTPALEQMATKAGGMFRLVKLNTDEHRSISQALEVQALPTVFGVRNGQILNSFQGMPGDEDALRNFMMGLLGAGPFDPPLSDKDKQKHAALSTKLLKVAGASSFPFSARERLQDRTKARLDDLVQERGGNMADAEESAATVRSLLSNVIRSPFETKFRRVNLANKVIAARIAAYPQCVSVLKSVGFVPDDGDENALVLAKGKKAVNLAPLVVARDTIDKWIDRNRYNIAAAARKKRDEAERAKLAEETARLQAEAGDEYDTEDETEEVDPDACSIRVRMEGKKRVHNLDMRADDPLSKLVESLPGDAKVSKDEEVRITCTAKRLIVKSTDEAAMAKTLREHGLAPAAAVVVKIGGTSPSPSSGSANDESKSKLAERAAARRGRKKGSQTMQSVGIYSKDDNAKGELIDGGGGVWYEHDVTSDDEAVEEGAAEEVEEAAAAGNDEDEDSQGSNEEEGGGEYDAHDVSDDEQA